jgi:hypothetical protein
MDQLRQDWAAARVLRAAFPTVLQLRIELKFTEPGLSAPASQSHVLYPPARAFFAYPCPYSDCDGQFDLAGAVTTATSNASCQVAGALECGGLRGGDHSKRPCLLRVVYEVTASVSRKVDADR